jgi:hypothetical protein
LLLLCTFKRNQTCLTSHLYPTQYNRGTLNLSSCSDLGLVGVTIKGIIGGQKWTFMCIFFTVLMQSDRTKCNAHILYQYYSLQVFSHFNFEWKVNINNNNNNNGLRRGEGICCHPNQRHVMRICSLSVLKTIRAWWRFSSYGRWSCWLTEHGRSKGVNLKKFASPRCILLCWGNTDAFSVEGKKPRTVNFKKWWCTVSSSLTAAGGAISQWTEDIPSYLWCSDGY